MFSRVTLEVHSFVVVRSKKTSGLLLELYAGKSNVPILIYLVCMHVFQHVTWIRQQINVYSNDDKEGQSRKTNITSSARIM